MEFNPSQFALPRDDSYLPYEDQSSHPEVAIYNEDDLSHLLYVKHPHHHPHHHHHHHHGNTKVVINAVAEELHLEHPSTGSQTPMSDNDHESAVLSDCESETDLEDVLPPSPSRPRALSFGSEDFEFPIFLGRQQEEPVTPPPVHIHPILRGPASGYQHVDKKVKILQTGEDGVESISGPLMSWWPAPVDTMEYQWASDKKMDKPKAVPVEHHVADIDGPLMTWWPPLMDMMEHEWVEKFYE